MFIWLSDTSLANNTSIPTATPIEIKAQSMTVKPKFIGFGAVTAIAVEVAGFMMSVVVTGHHMIADTIVTANSAMKV